MSEIRSSETRSGSPQGSESDQRANDGSVHVQEVHRPSEKRRSRQGGSASLGKGCATFAHFLCSRRCPRVARSRRNESEKCRWFESPEFSAYPFESPNRLDRDECVQRG